MAKFNYTQMKKTAERLVYSYGRKITLQCVAASDTDEDNITKSIEIDAVMVLPNQVRIFGLSALGESARPDPQIVETESVYIVVPTNQVGDIKQWNQIMDQGKCQRIMATQLLNPGELPMLAYIGTVR